MAKKRSIWKSKIRIRSVVRRMAEVEAATIDDFRDHVAAGAAERRRTIERSAAGLSDETQEHLADDIASLDVISSLGDQFSIVALHRVVELTVSRIVAHTFGVAAGRDAAYVRKLRQRLTANGVDIERIPHYRAANELRLLNNAIKHAGLVTAELAKAYPRWKAGQQLAGLGDAYERLRKHVPGYIFAFATRVKMQK